MKRMLKKCMFIMMMALMLSLFNVKSANAADTTKPVIDSIKPIEVYEVGIDGLRITAHDDIGLASLSIWFKNKPEDKITFDWGSKNYEDVFLGDSDYDDPNLYGIYCVYVTDKSGNQSETVEVNFSYPGIQKYGSFGIGYQENVTHYLSNGKKQLLDYVSYQWTISNMKWINNQIPLFAWNLKSSNESILKVYTDKSPYSEENTKMPYIQLTGKTGTATITGEFYCTNFPNVFRGSKKISVKVKVIDDTKKSTKKVVVGKPNVSLKKSGKKVTVKWKKAKNAKKYKVEWSTNKNMKKAKSKTLSSKKLSLKFNKSNKKKKYYVRVTAINGTTKAKSKVKKI